MHPKKREIFSLMLHLHTLKIMGCLEIVRPFATRVSKAKASKLNDYLKLGNMYFFPLFFFLQASTDFRAKWNICICIASKETPIAITW